MKTVFALAACCAWLQGCATYHPAPLGLTVPRAAPLPETKLTPAQVAVLAVRNDPDLTAARAQAGLSRADLLAAGLPPDPAVTMGFESLLGGPASMSSIAGSPTQDVSALITYKADSVAAKAGLAQVNAGILWQEWQVAAQAEQLCVSLQADARTVASLQTDEAALNEVNDATTRQEQARNLTLSDSTATAAALAATQSALDAARQTNARDLAALDALLALPSGTAIPLAPVTAPPIDPAKARQAIATLATRRPDLIALRYGYTQADAKLRAAIITQFLPVSLGASGGRDTSGVLTAGPQITLTLPLFNRNRAAIASAEATRTALAAQFTANLATSTGNAQSLLNSIALLQAQTQAADALAAQTGTTALAARNAFTAGGLNARDFASLQSTAQDRTRDAITLNAQLQTAEFSLATLLGYGLPPLAATDTEPKS